MNKKSEKWSDAVKSAFPSALSPYWRTMPIGRMKKLIVARLLSFLGVGCLLDLLQIRAQPLAHGLYWPTLLGVMGTALFIARVKRPRLFLPLDLLMFLGLLLGYLQVRASPTVPITEADFPRILADTLGALIGMNVGYRVLFSFNTTEGMHQVRMNTELSLAHGIQETLVPALSLDGPGFEVYGRCQGQSDRKPPGRRKREPVRGRIRWYLGGERALERSGRGLLPRGAFEGSVFGGWILFPATLLVAIAVAVHLQDVYVVGEPVEQGAGQPL
jgi:hypothetical protein